MSTTNRCVEGSRAEAAEEEEEEDQVIEETTEAETDETESDIKSSLTGHITQQHQQQHPDESPSPPPSQHHQPQPPHHHHHEHHHHHRHQPQEEQQQPQREHRWRPMGGDRSDAVRQRLAGIGHRLSAKATGCMRKVRRYRGGGGGAGGGAGGSGGSLPGPLGRLRDAIDERCSRGCRREDGSWWNPFGGERWTREMVRLREDVRRIQFWRSVVGEFIGSLFLVLIGCGASVETDHTERPVTVRVALAFGVTYAAGLYCLHSNNDGHLNTAVTVAMAFTRRVSVIRSLLYVATQLLGAVAGASALYWVTSDDYKTELGATRLSKSVTEGQGFLVEFFATSILVFVVFASYDDRNKDRTSLAPFIIGLTLMSVSLFSIPYTGGSMNTARSFGPAVVLNSWKNHWIYWFGPILGGVAGGFLHELLFSANSSFRRVRKCLLLFERRRTVSSSNPSVASSAHDPEETKTKKKMTEEDATRQKNDKSSTCVKINADFEAAPVDCDQRSWEQSREEEEEDDEEDDEEEEEEELQTMRRQKTATKDGEEEIEELSDEDDPAAKSYLRRSSSYLKSLAAASSSQTDHVLTPAVTVTIPAAAKMRSSISTASSSTSLNKTGLIVSTLAPTKEDATSRLSIHAAIPAESIVIDGKYDDVDDDDEEDFSGKGGTVPSDDTSDSLEDV